MTNLLNRAITLATEASNGTLNSSQEAAANQEYTSILSEVNNIGSTTTYNQTQVFTGNTVSIYTGDSSTVGSSIDNLTIRTLSESSVGDTGGQMAYSDGATSAFLNLSTSTSNAQATDTLTGGPSGSSTINVAYLVKGANGASMPASTSITVGAGTNYSNTANGLMSAINNAGLGLTASFTTQAAAGVTGGGTQTGIQITGGLISVGVDPNAFATSATLNPSSITDSNLTAGQTITVMTGTTKASQVTLDQSDNTLAGLASKINSGTGGAGGVTATVVYDSTGNATSLQITDSSSTGGALTVTSSSVGTSPNSEAVTWTAGATGAVGVQGTANLAIAGTGSNSSTQVLTGTIALANGSNSKTFVMGGTAGTSQDGNTITLGSSTSTMSTLAAAITANLGATATASASGIAITSTATGSNITQGTSTLAASLSAGVTSNVSGMAATSGTDGSTTIAMTGDSMGITATQALTAATAITLKNGNGTAVTITSGTNVADVIGANGNTTSAITTTANTVNGFLNAINDNTASLGMTASIVNGAIVVSSTNVNTSIIASANTLAGTQAVAVVGGGTTVPPTSIYSTTNVTVGTGNPLNNSLTTTGDTLAGTMTISNSGVTDTFIMGGSAASDTANIFHTGAATLASLQSKITGASNLGVTATSDITGIASGLTLTANAYGTTIAVGGTGITETSTVGTDAQSTIGTGGAQYLTSTLSADDGGVVAANSVYSGTFVIGETGTAVTGASANLNVIVGSAGANDATHLYIPGTLGKETMANIATAINTYIGTVANSGGDKFSLTASVDTNTGGLTVQSSLPTTGGANQDTALSISAVGGSFIATQTMIGGAVTNGSIAGPAVETMSNTLSNLSATDTFTVGSQLILGNSVGSAGLVTFTMGAAAGTETGDGTSTVLVGANAGGAGNTLGALIQAINSQTNMDMTASVVGGKLQIQSTGAGGTGTITEAEGATALTQAYGVGQVGGSISGVTVNAGGGPTGATNAAVTINTSHGMNTAGTDPLAGQITLTNSTNNIGITFNLNSSATSGATHIELTAGNSTLNGLVAAINANATLGMTASVNATTGALQIQSNTSNTAITVAGAGLTDATKEVLSAGTQAVPSGKSTASINLTTGSLTENGESDELTGAISVSADGTTTNYVMAGSTATFNSGTTVDLSAANSTVSGFAAALLANQGLSATVNSGSIALQSGTNDAYAIGITNNALYDTLGFGTTASLSVAAGNSYNLGVSNVATTGVYDSSTGQAVVTATNGTAAFANMTSNGSKSSGIATMSYSDGAGQSLSGTNLLTQSAAQTALIDLNLAITDVSAQDGYIGAQINTLNSVSQVLTTQQENVTSAQNAVQATDYASATAAMSKYEILSQTGISALAQANTVQQEVTKLLQ